MPRFLLKNFNWELNDSGLERSFLSGKDFSEDESTRVSDVNRLLQKRLLIRPNRQSGLVEIVFETDSSGKELTRLNFAPSSIKNGYDLIGVIYHFYQSINPKTGNQYIDDIGGHIFFEGVQEYSEPKGRYHVNLGS